MAGHPGNQCCPGHDFSNANLSVSSCIGQPRPGQTALRRTCQPPGNRLPCPVAESGAMPPVGSSRDACARSHQRHSPGGDGTTFTADRCRNRNRVNPPPFARQDVPHRACLSTLKVR